MFVIVKTYPYHPCLTRNLVISKRKLNEKKMVMHIIESYFYLSAQKIQISEITKRALDREGEFQYEGQKEIEIVVSMVILYGVVSYFSH